MNRFGILRTLCGW